MKKIICYTDNVGVYLEDRTTSFYLGALNPADIPEPYIEPEPVVNATATVELVTAGVSVEDIVKLKLNGLL